MCEIVTQAILGCLRVTWHSSMQTIGQVPTGVSFQSRWMSLIWDWWLKVFYQSLFKTQTLLLPWNSGEQIKSLGLFLSSSSNLSGSYYSIKLQFKNDVTCSTCSPTTAEMPVLSQSLFSWAWIPLSGATRIVVEPAQGFSPNCSYHLVGRVHIYA